MHLSCQNSTCGNQRKSLTHSFYQDCYLYKVCVPYKAGRDQYLLETNIQSFTQSLSYCHTTESPQKWPVFSSFLLPFTAEPPSAELAFCRMLMWIQSMERVFALHTQDSSILRIQMRLSRSGSSSTALSASLLGLQVFTLIFLTFGFGLYILRPTCLVVLIRKFVVAFHMSAHSGSECHSYS